jgi:acyl-CoA synthetase (AMP-forming)/AMP-acid ligase II
MQNIGQLLLRQAELAPERTAVIATVGRDRGGKNRYRQWTFAQLELETRLLACGLLESGVPRDSRLVLFVPFSWQFITLTYTLLRAGMTAVLVDPGMGKASIIDCLRQVRPQGFVAVSKAHAIRVLKRKLFPEAVHNVTVGRRWFWGGATYPSLLALGARNSSRVIDTSQADEPAAIIFTSGSTGSPKGVVYEHGMFVKQVELIQRQYGIEPDEVDLPGFPLFGLFNAAMGVTTVIPDMDPTRPADVEPERILTQIRDQQVTQAFGSPAFWNRVGRYCDEQKATLPTIRRALSAGGPVPIHVLERMSRALTRPEAQLHTPYGATESLPVSTIGSREVLEKTAARTRIGQGTCVGRLFDEIDVKIIRMTDGPIAKLSNAVELPVGEVGEIIVSGPSVTREYFQHADANRLGKIVDDQEGETPAEPAPLMTLHAASGSAGASPSQARSKLWHRIGDVGYFDNEGRLWFCGRKSHVVHAAGGPMFSVCCEAIFNEHPQVYRSALIALGDRAPFEPAIVIEPAPGCFPATNGDERTFADELLALGSRTTHTASIRRVFFHRSFPVDTRHNVKINREALREWAMR